MLFVWRDLLWCLYFLFADGPPWAVSSRNFRALRRLANEASETHPTPEPHFGLKFAGGGWRWRGSLYDDWSSWLSDAEASVMGAGVDAAETIAGIDPGTAYSCDGLQASTGTTSPFFFRGAGPPCGHSDADAATYKHSFAPRLPTSGGCVGPKRGDGGSMRHCRVFVIQRGVRSAPPCPLNRASERPQRTLPCSAMQ